MRVMYVSQYFVSAQQAGGVRHWHHTQALRNAGHAVSVVTSYVQHKDRTIAERYRGRRVVREVEDGVEMWRVYSTPGYGRDLRSRLSNYTSFAFWAGVAMARVRRPRVVVASSPSLPAAGVAAVAAKLRRARFVLEVRDLWPDSAVAMGLVNDRATIAAATRLEDFCYRRADHIVALTEGIRDGMIAKGVPARKITLITNGVDLTPDGPPPQPAALDVPEGTTVAMYVGAHGTYSSLNTVLDAAHLLRDRTDIRIVLVGGGDQKAALLEQARTLELTNVTFIDLVPKSEVPGWLARADICLLPYQDRELFAGALPNKVFDYLAAAKPILAAAPEGELTRLIREVDCGRCVPAERPAEMADAIRALADSPDRAVMGRRGLEVALERYDRRALAARFVAVVEGVGA
ncbi:MAG: glycosyltransferase family 4 protein [Thermoleophilia bacterium]